MIIVGIVLLIMSATIKIPDKTLSYYDGVDKYVGVDAYNYIIAAEFRASEISTAKIIQTIYLVAGIAFLAIGVGVNIVTFLPNGSEQTKAQNVSPETTVETISNSKPTETVLGKINGIEKTDQIVVKNNSEPIVVTQQPSQEDIKSKAIQSLVGIAENQNKQEFYLALEKWQDKYGNKLLYWDLTLYNKIGNFFNDVSYTSTYDSEMREKRTYNIKDEDFTNIVSAIKAFCKSV